MMTKVAVGISLMCLDLPSINWLRNSQPLLQHWLNNRLATTLEPQQEEECVDVEEIDKNGIIDILVVRELKKCCDNEVGGWLMMAEQNLITVNQLRKYCDSSVQHFLTISLSHLPTD
jgi:hypothetical protein